MAISRIFCYNPDPNPTILGTEQIGDLAVAVGYVQINPALQWWNGPDESLGYVIAYTQPTDDHPNAPERILLTNYPCNLGFLRTATLSDIQFIELAKKVTNDYTISTANQAKTTLNQLGYWTSYGSLPPGMVLFLDAGDANSYPGTGNDWYDLSGVGNHGTLSGNAVFSTQSGGSIEFDGSGDYVGFSTVNEIPIGNEPYTISVWFNSDEMPSIRGFVGWGAFNNINQVNAWRLQNFSGSSGFVHYWWGNDLIFQTPMSSGNWYHAVASYENGSRKIYLNNVQVAEDFPTGHNVPYATNLRIGVTADFLGEWFDGKIAQVVIYKRQASVGEIQALWDSGKSRFGY